MEEEEEEEGGIEEEKRGIQGEWAHTYTSNSHFGLKPIAFSSTTCKYPTLNLQTNIPISQVESCHLKLQLEMHKIQTLFLPLNLRWSVSQLADILRLVLPSTSPTAYLDRRKVKLSISASQTHKYTNTQTHKYTNTNPPPVTSPTTYLEGPEEITILGCPRCDDHNDHHNDCDDPKFDNNGNDDLPIHCISCVSR